MLLMPILKEEIRKDNVIFLYFGILSLYKAILNR